MQNANIFSVQFSMIYKRKIIFEFAAELPPHLHGLTFIGENIQDEWFIVEILFRLTERYPHLIARILDADGEFMLIEAADVLPKWANPDTCVQRVKIHKIV